MPRTLSALALAIFVANAIAFELRAVQKGERPAADQSIAPPVIDTQHLSAKLSASVTAIEPRARFSLFIDVTPKPKMHVYSPEQEGTIPISVALSGDVPLRTYKPVFPKPEKYFFAPLNETQLVYSKPFRIIQGVALTPTPAAVERGPSGGSALTIKGTLRYQACDDAICYLPKNVPVSWTIPLKLATLQ